MPDLLMFLLIGWIQGIGKFFSAMWTFGWMFWKYFMLLAIWVAVIPLWDVVMIILTPILWLLCKLFKWKTPKLKRGKWLSLYPAWNY